MTRLPALTARDVIRKLKRAGFVFDRQAKGSHEIWHNPITKRRTTIPNHPGAESTNNRAEKSLREHVVQRKIVGTGDVGAAGTQQSPDDEGRMSG